MSRDPVSVSRSAHERRHLKWYQSIPVGRFEGNYSLCPVGPDRFRYIPGIVPLAFIRASGEVVQPGPMITDGGSINPILQVLSGITPWKYWKAFPLHDWEYDLHHAGQSTKSFEEVNQTLYEAIKTMMADKDVPVDVGDLVNIRRGVASRVARTLWNKPGKMQPPPAIMHP